MGIAPNAPYGPYALPPRIMGASLRNPGQVGPGRTTLVAQCRKAADSFSSSFTVSACARGDHDKLRQMAVLAGKLGTRRKNCAPVAGIAASTAVYAPTMRSSTSRCFARHLAECGRAGQVSGKNQPKAM
jgi:hypothetical protein